MPLLIKMNVTAQQLQSMLHAGETLQLVDVRSRSEFDSGHIPRATNFPMDEIEARIDDLSKTQKVVLLCQSGRRAGVSCALLAQHHPDVLVLEGGTVAWTQAGLPLVRSSKTRWSLERQVRLAAGLLVLSGIALAALVSPAWIFLSTFVALGLIFAGLTDICGMASLFAIMPWNRPSAKAPSRAASTEEGYVS